MYGAFRQDMNQSNKTLGCEIAGGMLALAAIVIALLAWLVPFHPVGPSPVRLGTSQANQELPSHTPVMVTVVVVATTVAPQQLLSATQVPPPAIRLPPTATPVRPTATRYVPPTLLPLPAATPLKLPNGEVVTAESLARNVGGNAAYWTVRGPVVWGYWDKGHNVTFRHPGGNTLLSYWAGFPDPRNADGCRIVYPPAESGTRFVKCPSGTRAEFEADGVGFHLVDYTGYFQ